MTGRDISAGWIDVTRSISVGMPVWPGDPPVSLERVLDMNLGEECNVSRLSMCTHSGTHLDAPIHFIHDGNGVETAPLKALMGLTRVISIDDPQCIRLDELLRYNIAVGERLIFKTVNTAAGWTEPFRPDFVYLDKGAALHLADERTLLVGIDGMSVGGYYSDMVDTHVALLTAGVWIMENLNLEHIEAGEYEMICLPIKLTGADGAPCRVLLRPA